MYLWNNGPFQHGEVFVTDDGAETDLDLVTERSLGTQKIRQHNSEKFIAM